MGKFSFIYSKVKGAVLLGGVFGLMLSGNLQAAEPSPIQAAMLRDLESVQNIFQVQYAPKAWKEKSFQWDLDSKMAEAKAAVLKIENPTKKDYQQILKKFILSTQDYHVGLRFYATETSQLYFTVFPVKNRYFISSIDRSRLSKDSFPFEIGDELVSMNNKATDEVIQEIISEEIYTGAKITETVRALAAKNLTKRSAASGQKVPQGLVDLGIRRKGSSQVSSHELLWNYMPEKINFSPSAARPTPLMRAKNRPLKKWDFLNKIMLAEDFDSSLYGDENVDNPFELGARKSYIPFLGEADEESKAWRPGSGNPFLSYDFSGPNNKKIGYVRIPHFVPEDSDAYVAAFAEIIEHMEKECSALVIDQINNPGGSVLYLYALASMLSDGNSLKTPLHRFSISGPEVSEAYEFSEMIPDPNVHTLTDFEAQMLFGKSAGGFPVTSQWAYLMKNHAQFVLSEYAEMQKNPLKILSEPHFIAGVNKINAAKIHFTKPILLIVNSLDFSGGDFFPAILQDNKRVKVFGSRTAGAGGYVKQVSYPNNFLVSQIRLTSSIAERVNQEPIENLGVTPDVPYEISQNDIENNFSEYREAIRKESFSLLGTAASESIEGD